MTPTIEQLAQSRASLLTEASDLETRATELRKQAVQTEGVMMFLQQQAKQEADAKAAEEANTQADRLASATAQLQEMSDSTGKSKLT